MENCHVVSGSCNGIVINDRGGLVASADNATYTACSVISSGVGLCGGNFKPEKITACYVFGSTLGTFGEIAYEDINQWCFNSYYQQSAGGSITGEGSSSEVSDWSEAAQSMNSSLTDKPYQWVENTGSDKADRPLVIKTQTTN